MENNTNNNNFLGLEEMQQQMKALQTQLDEQVQVDDTLLQKQISQKVRNLNLNGIGMLIFAIVGLPFIYIYAQYYHISQACTISLMAMTLVIGLYDYLSTNMVHKSDLLQADVITAIQKVIKMKNFTYWGSKLEWTLNIISIGWLFFETIIGPRFMSLSQPKQNCFLIVYALLVVLCILLQTFTDNKHRKTMQELLQLLEQKQ